MEPAQANEASQPATAAAISASGADSREFKNHSSGRQVLEIEAMELAAPPWSLNHIQPYTVIDDKCNENICVGCLADVEAGFEELPQMRKAAVHLQHAYEHLKFEPNKGLSIDMKAFREGPHKAECRKLDKWLIAN